jgi:hypothetical protein
MKIPFLNVATKETTLPASKQRVKIRPYLVGEEKAVLMAVESRDPKEALAAVKNLIRQCIIEPKKIDVDEISTLDVEFLFLELRKMSVDNKAKIGISHQNTENSACKHVETIEIDLNDIKVGKFDGVIQLRDDTKVLMRLPSFKDVEELQAETSEVKKVFFLIQRCLDTIYMGELVMHTKDFPVAEVTGWIDNLNTEQFRKINEFFNTIPQITYDLDYTCSKCGKTEHIEVKGLASFL